MGARPLLRRAAKESLLSGRAGEEAMGEGRERAGGTDMDTVTVSRSGPGPSSAVLWCVDR